MSPILLPLYGPFAIHAYGFFIASGFVCFLFFLKRDIRYQGLHIDHLLSPIIFFSVVAALVGGRLVYQLTEDDVHLCCYDFFAFWQGGFSILGSLSAVFVALIALFFYYKQPLFPFLDVVSIYAPLLQAFGRVGCFFAGCCYGICSDSWYAVEYTDLLSLAPLHVKLFPVQVVSAISLAFLSFFLYYLSQKTRIGDGSIFFLYFFCAVLERFLIDFLRADRLMIIDSLSYNQFFACILMVSGLGIFFIITLFKKRRFFEKWKRVHG